MRIKLYQTVDKFFAKKYQHLKIRFLLLQFLFYFLSTLIIVSATAVAILTAIVISKLWISEFPDWYLYFTTGMSAMATFFSSILNFFFVQEKYIDTKRKMSNLEIINLKYTQKSASKELEYKQFIEIAHVLGYGEIMREEHHG